MSKSPASRNTADLITPSKVEIMAPSWDRAVQLMDGIRHALRLSLAGQVLLGLELQQLKKAHGMGRGANAGGPVGHFVRPDKKWPDLVAEKLGVSYKTADRFIDSWEAAKARIKKLGGTTKLLSLVETAPGSISQEDRLRLAGIVEKITDGTSQKELLEELKFVKLHVSLKGGDTSANRKDTNEDKKLAQLAFDFFRPLAKSLQTLRTDNDRDAYLNVIDIYSSDEAAVTLTTLERDLEASLSAVRAAKEARMKPINGKS